MSRIVPPVRSVATAGIIAARSMVRRPLATAAAIGAVAASLLLVGAVHLAAHNARGLVSGLEPQTHMVVYLTEQAAAVRAQEIATVLRSLTGVESAEVVDETRARQRLNKALAGRDIELDLDGVPASIEVAFSAGITDVASTHPIVDKLRETPGIESVELLDDWGAALASIWFALRLAAVALALVVGATCTFLVALALRASLASRRRELRVMELVGASASYTRLPVLLEGAAQGLIGAGLALAGLWGLYRLATSTLPSLEGVARESFQWSFFPAEHGMIAAVAGACLGVVGAWFGLLRASAGGAVAR